MKTITLDQIENTKGVDSITIWEKGGIKRWYVNLSDRTVSKLWWEQDGKLRFEIGKGTSSTEANETIERLIGCEITSRYSKAPEYLIVK